MVQERVPGDIILNMERSRRLCRISGGFIFMACIIVTCHCTASFASDDAAYRHAKEGAAKAGKGDYRGAIDEMRAALMYDPSNKVISNNLATLYNNYAMSLMKKDDLPMAIENFEKSLSYNGNDANTLYNLGAAYYKVQNMTKAHETLERAYKLKPDMKGIKELLKKASGESGVESGFQRTETPHFIIASSGDIPVEKLSYIRTWLEEAYGRVGGVLDHYPGSKTIVTLYSEANYDKMLKGKPHWAMALFDGKVRIPVNKAKYTDEEVVKVIYHEYAHAVVFDICRNNCPLWINEGIASKAEDLYRPRDRAMVKRYIDRFGMLHVLKIPDNFSAIADANKATALYIESYLLTDFIADRNGPGVLADLLEYLKSGKTIGSAINYVLKTNIEQFEKNCSMFAKDKFGIENPVFN